MKRILSDDLQLQFTIILRNETSVFVTPLVHYHCIHYISIVAKTTRVNKLNLNTTKSKINLHNFIRRNDDRNQKIKRLRYLEKLKEMKRWGDATGGREKG